MENKYRRRGIVTLRGKLPLDKVSNAINKISIKDKNCELRKKIKNNPSKLKDEINDKTFDLMLLTKEIEKLKEKQNQLQISINNYKNSTCVATKFLSGLENDLEKVINEIALKEKEKEMLIKNL